jgi:hypothetical protein
VAALVAATYAELVGDLLPTDVAARLRAPLAGAVT